MDDLRDAIHSRPMAIILAFPTNPAQFTYSGDRLSELTRILDLCNEYEVFVIADNVYQDTLWRQAAANPEVLALAGSKWIVKVSSTSKDRPAHAGLRIGYWCGDPRLQERFFYYASIQYNTPNSASRCVLGIEILFRTLEIDNRDLQPTDLELLGDHIAGWARPLDRVALFDELLASGLQARYRERLRLIENPSARGQTGYLSMPHARYPRSPMW